MNLSKCVECAHENADDAAFCARCGTALSVAGTCAACGAVRRGVQPFCGECGARLAGEPADEAPAGRGSGDGERKQVTVLFADVKGSMDLSGDLDAEQWWTIMDRLFGLLCEGVNRYDGRVERFTGDGIMATFGAPIAHEDHARRACHAALWLRERLREHAQEVRREHGLDFAVRIGLNSGEVVVGPIGDGPSLEYTAIGRAAGFAQRMESLAEPGSAYLTESTARLVAGFFALEPQGALDVKGVRDPVRVYELLGPGELRTPFDASRARGFSRFVGREEELARLDAALASALAGEGAVVGVVGEPGVGKSRLCHVFAEYCRGEDIEVREVHALSHTTAVPFVTVLELLRATFGITPSDDDAVARDKVATQLAALGEGIADELALLWDFLGVGDPEHPEPRIDPEAKQRRLFATFNLMLRARSSNRVAVILAEDLHWLDSGSAAFLENLVVGLTGTRTLLLTTFRPEYRPAWMEHDHCQSIALAPLGEQASDLLAASLLGPDSSIDGLRELVCERAAGNPFFIEEIIKALADNGTLAGTRGDYRLTRTIADVVLPLTVESVLAARIDRLGPSEKRVLQTAAVIGREFDEAVLRRVAGTPEDELTQALADLVAAELITAGVTPGEYAFKHALIEQVAYRTQLGTRRARVHAAVAAAIIEQYPDGADERAALVAHHWEAAGDTLEATRWLARAAVWAGFKDPLVSQRHWERVRQLADSLPAGPERDELALGARMMLMNWAWRLGAPGTQTSDQFEDAVTALHGEARALAAKTENVNAEAVVTSLFGVVRGFGGHNDDWLALAQEAATLAERGGDEGVQLAVRPALVYALGIRGRYTEALASADQGIALGERNPVLGNGLVARNPYAFLFAWQGVARAYLGRLDAAWASLERGVEVARENGDVESEGWMRMLFSQVAEFQGSRGEEALAQAQLAFEMTEQTGGTFSRGLARQYLGLAHVVLGEWPAAIELLEGALAIWRSGHVGLDVEPQSMFLLARAHLGLGDHAAARGAVERAVLRSVQRNTKGWELQARLGRAQVLRASEAIAGAAAIEGELERSVALAAETGALALQPRIHVERAELHRLRGELPESERELAEARRRYLQIGAVGLADGLRLTAPGPT